MDRVSQSVLESFVQAARKVAACTLVQCGSGNLSWRLDDARMLITATGAWMEELTEGQTVLCSIEGAKSLDLGTPSIEIGFHAGILKDRADVNVVLHFQSPHATTVACCKPDGTDFSVIPEVPYYVGPVARVPYEEPGSPALALSVTRAMRDHDLVLIDNHGQVAVGRDFREVLQRAVFFELACQVLLHGGGAVQVLSRSARQSLYRAREEAHSGSKGVRKRV